MLTLSASQPFQYCSKIRLSCWNTAKPTEYRSCSSFSCSALQCQLAVAFTLGHGCGCVCGNGGVREEIAVIDLRGAATDQVGVAHTAHQVVVAGDVGQSDQATDDADESRGGVCVGCAWSGFLCEVIPPVHTRVQDSFVRHKLERYARGNSSTAEQRVQTKEMDGVGLVLSGGGARGVAHVGVIKFLEEIGVLPNVVAGTSAGALVGSLYAAGYNAQEMLDFFLRTTVFSPKNYAFRKPGLIDLEGFIPDFQGDDPSRYVRGLGSKAVRCCNRYGERRTKGLQCRGARSVRCSPRPLCRSCSLRWRSMGSCIRMAVSRIIFRWSY